MKNTKVSLLVGSGLAFSLTAICGCRTVAPHQREHLAHPSMQQEPEEMGSYSRTKLHSTREGAAGGDGKPAGGGCGCGN